jgi:hypothetical protein
MTKEEFFEEKTLSLLFLVVLEDTNSLKNDQKRFLKRKNFRYCFFKFLKIHFNQQIFLKCFDRYNICYCFLKFRRIHFNQQCQFKMTKRGFYEEKPPLLLFLEVH